MKTKQTFLAVASVALVSLAAPHAHSALLASQYGILDLTANGGINPNTGVAWQAGDQYRLAFFTSNPLPAGMALSNDPATYNNFVTAQAHLNPALAGSTWNAGNWGSSNANRTGRVYLRFDNGNLTTTSTLRMYALSDALTVFAIPEPSSAALLGLGGLLLLGRRRRKACK